MKTTAYMLFPAVLFLLTGCLQGGSTSSGGSDGGTGGSSPPLVVGGAAAAPGDEPPIVDGSEGPQDAPFPGGVQRTVHAPVITYVGSSN